MADTNEFERLAATAPAEALRDDPFYAAIKIDFEADGAVRHAERGPAG